MTIKLQIQHTKLQLQNIKMEKQGKTENDKKL